MTKNQKGPKNPKTTAPKNPLAQAIADEAAKIEAEKAANAAPKITMDADEKKAAEAQGKTILSATQVAATLGVSAYEFRSFLRELGGYDDKKYTKYGFEQGGPELAKVLKIWADYQAKKAEDAAKKAAAKAAPATTKDTEAKG